MSDNQRSILIGAGLAAAGAVAGVLLDAASSGAFGGYSALVGAVVSVLLNVLRKYGTPAAAALLAVLVFSAPGYAQYPAPVVTYGPVVYAQPVYHPGTQYQPAYHQPQAVYRPSPYRPPTYQMIVSQPAPQMIFQAAPVRQVTVNGASCPNGRCPNAR